LRRRRKNDVDLKRAFSFLTKRKEMINFRKAMEEYDNKPTDPNTCKSCGSTDFERIVPVPHAGLRHRDQRRRPPIEKFF
jgi:hypothetical protein